MSGILLAYKVTTFQALNSDTFDFELTILKGIFIKSKKKIIFGVPNHCNLKSFTDNWDELIKSKKKIKFGSVYER